MSAMGQKQTWRFEAVMSTIHPKADIELASSMSAKCHKLTSPHSITSSAIARTALGWLGCRHSGAITVNDRVDGAHWG
jgi:hypothetical protein